MSEKRSTWSIALVPILAKAGKLLKLVKLFKVAKPIVLFVSMSISAVAYALFLGPWLGILFTLLLLLHEMGHVVAMKQKGMPTPTPVFVPFLGAAIFAQRPDDRDTEAYVGYGGPLLGTIAALLPFAAWFFLSSDSKIGHVCIVASYLGMILNLFNLLPISPLDGGRITQAVGGWFKFLGLLGLAAISFVFREPVILYVWILVLYEFSLIPITLRAFMTASCWVAMASLMWMGYGDQPVWLNILDCVVTLPFVGFTIAQVVKGKEFVPPDDRPALERGARYKWAGLYFALAIFLIGMIILQLPFLPHK